MLEKKLKADLAALLRHEAAIERLMANPTVRKAREALSDLAEADEIQMEMEVTKNAPKK